MSHASAFTRSGVAIDTWRRRENLWSGAILLMLTAIAWTYTLYRANAIDMGLTTGEMGDMRMLLNVN